MERVCVIGAGAIGSLFAGHLAAVADVSVLTRRERARRRAATATACASAAAATATRRVRASADPAELAPFDLGIVATKAGGLEGAVESLRGRFPDATIMTVLNGLGAEEAVRARRRLADHLGRHVHERHAPLGHARRVRARHRDLARAVRGRRRSQPCRRRPTLIVERRPQGRGAARPAARRSGRS